MSSHTAQFERNLEEVISNLDYEDENENMDIIPEMAQDVSQLFKEIGPQLDD